jgi:hypothetical protein
MLLGVIAHRLMQQLTPIGEEHHEGAFLQTTKGLVVATGDLLGRLVVERAPGMESLDKARRKGSSNRFHEYSKTARVLFWRSGRWGRETARKSIRPRICDTTSGNPWLIVRAADISIPRGIPCN